MLFCWFRGLYGAGLEAEAIVSGLQDMAVVRDAIEERSGHLGVRTRAVQNPKAERSMNVTRREVAASAI
jgi:hypothetical protein